MNKCFALYLQVSPNKVQEQSNGLTLAEALIALGEGRKLCNKAWENKHYYIHILGGVLRNNSGSHIEPRNLQYENGWEVWDATITPEKVKNGQRKFRNKRTGDIETYLGIDPLRINGEVLLTTKTSLTGYTVVIERTWEETLNVLEIA